MKKDERTTTRKNQIEEVMAMRAASVLLRFTADRAQFPVLSSIVALDCASDVFPLPFPPPCHIHNERLQPAFPQKVVARYTRFIADLYLYLYLYLLIF